MNEKFPLSLPCSHSCHLVYIHSNPRKARSDIQPFAGMSIFCLWQGEKQDNEPLRLEYWAPLKAWKIPFRCFPYTFHFRRLPFPSRFFQLIKILFALIFYLTIFGEQCNMKQQNKCLSSIWGCCNFLAVKQNYNCGELGIFDIQC